MIFTERLSVLLKAKKISRKTLSRATGIKYSTICSWYVRRSNRINMVTLQKLSAFFGIDINYLANPAVNEKKLLNVLNRNHEVFSNIKTDKLLEEIDSLKSNPDITELDILIAKSTASLDTISKVQIYIVIGQFKNEVEEGNKPVMISVGPVSQRKKV